MYTKGYLNIAFVLVVAFLAIGCGVTEQQQFALKLHMAAYPNKQVALEELDLDKVTLVNNGTTDDKGVLELSGVFSKPNLYRVSIDSVGYIYFVLDAKEISIQLDSTHVIDYTISGSKRSSQLHQFMQQMFELNKHVIKEELLPKPIASNANTKENTLVPDSSLHNTSSTSSAKNTLLNFIQSNADTASFLPLALFYANFLPLEEKAQYLKSFTHKLRERFASETTLVDAYERAFFSTYNAFINDKKIQTDSFSYASIINKTMPKFQLKDPEGASVSSQIYKDKYLVIQFVGSWNANSRAANKQMQAVYNQLVDYPVQLISVFIEQDSMQWISSVKEDNLPWPQLSSIKSWNCAYIQAMKVVTVPTTIIIDPQQKVIGADWTINDIITEIKNRAPKTEPVDTARSGQALSKHTHFFRGSNVLAVRCCEMQYSV